MTGLRWFAALFSAVSTLQTDEFAADRHRRLAAARMHSAVGRKVIASADTMDRSEGPPADTVDALRSLMSEVARRADR